MMWVIYFTGFVIARPLIDTCDTAGTQTSFYHVMGSNKKKVKVYTRQANEAPERMEFLRNKRFVVKVQVPIPVPSQNNMPNFGSDQMMVYNADRTVDGFIYSTEKGRTVLHFQQEVLGINSVCCCFFGVF